MCNQLTAVEKAKTKKVISFLCQKRVSSYLCGKNTTKMRLISHTRTLFCFLLLMSYAICVTGNMVGATTDYFLSFLLPIFDCYLICAVAALLKRARLGFVISLPAIAIVFAELFTVIFYHSNFSTYVVLLLLETNGKESSEFVTAALRQPQSWYALLLTLAMGGLSLLLARLSRKPFRYRRIVVVLAIGLIAWSGIRQISAYGRLFRCFSSKTTAACNDPRNIPHQNTPFVRLAYGIAYNMAASSELNVLEQAVAATTVDS